MSPSGRVFCWRRKEERGGGGGIRVLIWRARVANSGKGVGGI